jgi:hypothetical protein
MKKKNISISIPEELEERIKLEAEKEKLSLSDFLIFKTLGIKPKVTKVPRTYEKTVKGKKYYEERLIKEVRYE